MEKEMLLYYIRHGDPIYEPECLTELGHKQANALAKRLALYGLDRIYSSTALRARQTAQPTCKFLHKEMALLDWAHEATAWEYFTLIDKNGNYKFAFQDYETVTQFNNPEVLALGKEWYRHDYFQKNKYKQGVLTVDKKADEFLLSLGYKHDRKNNRYEVVKTNDERVALFAHQAFGMAFLSSILDIPYPMFCTKFDMGHSSVTVIHFEEKEEYVYPRMLQLSNDSHLYKEEILTGYHNLINI